MSSENSVSDQRSGRVERWLRFDRRDGLGLALVLWLVVVGVVGGLVVGPILAWWQGDPVVATVETRLQAPELERLSVDYLRDGSVAFLVGDPTTLQRWASIAPGIVLAVAVVFGVVLLRRVTRDLIDGDVFDQRNVRRLRLIAAVLIIGPVLWQWADAAAAGVLAPDLDEFTLTVDFAPLLMSMIAGLVAAMVAEAIRRGIELREDAEGVI